MYNHYKTRLKKISSLFKNVCSCNMTSGKVTTVLLFCISLTLVSAMLPGLSKYYFNKYNYNQDRILSKFREYLTIDTSSGKNIEKAVEFWKDLANEIGLPLTIYTPDEEPIVVITWEGLDPSLPSIMLNSHMDVVPADEGEWTYPPFAAHMDDNGDIYGRGAQDTKDVSMQYFEAVKKLKEDNVHLLRTIHLTLMPDEETGGYKGMKSFVKTEDFAKLNVGFALDEGLSSDNNTLLAVYEDRRPWQMEFTIFGEGGHGSMMPDDNAATKVSTFLNRVTEFRNKNIRLKKSTHSLDYGKYTSININIMKGGYAVNVIPSNITIGVDMRLSSDSTVAEMDELINSWMSEAGNETRVSYIRREEISEKTILDESNHYWVAMKLTLNNMGYDVATLVCPATSDMLNLRNLGYAAVGFSPKLHTTSRIHGKDEYINADTYLHGIQIYYELIKSLGNVI